MKEINLNNSFIFSSANTNVMRLKIKSILINKNKNEVFYLTKECRSELIGKNPFLNTQRYEYLPIFTQSGKFLTLRNQALDFIFRSRKNHKYQISSTNFNESHKIVLRQDEIEILELGEINSKLKTRSTDQFFCRIEYKFAGQNFICLSNCDYLNFDYSENTENKNQIYLQPISGYVPFEKDDKIYASYMARYISNNYQGNLNFLLRNENTPFDASKGNFVFKLIKIFLNYSLFFLKKNEFCDYISIENSKITFFKYK